MATVTLSNATLQFIKIGSKDYVRLPIGSTGFTNPTTPANSASWTTTFANEWEFEYNTAKTAKDSGNPSVVFCEYVGGRPTGR